MACSFSFPFPIPQTPKATVTLSPPPSKRSASPFSCLSLRRRTNNHQTYPPQRRSHNPLARIIFTFPLLSPPLFRFPILLWANNEAPAFSRLRGLASKLIHAWLTIPRLPSLAVRPRRLTRRQLEISFTRRRTRLPLFRLRTTTYRFAPGRCCLHSSRTRSSLSDEHGRHLRFRHRRRRLRISRLTSTTMSSLRHRWLRLHRGSTLNIVQDLAACRVRRVHRLR